MSGYVFCAIPRGEQPGSTFYADDVVAGLLDINPVTAGLAALDGVIGQHLWTVAQRTAARQRG